MYSDKIPPELLMDGDIEEDIYICLNTLQEIERHALLLYFKEHYTLKKIGEILIGKPVIAQRTEKIIERALNILTSPTKKKLLNRELSNSEMQSYYYISSKNDITNITKEGYIGDRQCYTHIKVYLDALIIELDK
jgi:hypothetical protein